MRARLCGWVVAFTLLGVGCSKSNANYRCWFESNGAKGKQFDIEVVNDNQSRQLGLMYRKEMPSSYGMLFIYPEVEVHSHWMRNTYVSLDMLFLDDQQKLLGIVPEVPILNDLPRSIESPSRFVLELAAGQSVRDGISVGSKLECETPLPKGF